MSFMHTSYGKIHASIEGRDEPITSINFRPTEPDHDFDKENE